MTHCGFLDRYILPRSVWIQPAERTAGSRLASPSSPCCCLNKGFYPQSSCDLLEERAGVWYGFFYLVKLATQRPEHSEGPLAGYSYCARGRACGGHAAGAMSSCQLQRRGICILYLFREYQVVVCTLNFRLRSVNKTPLRQPTSTTHLPMTTHMKSKQNGPLNT